MSNQIVEKKRKEMAIVEALKECHGAFPSGHLDASGENPDAVVITAGGHVVGIELTELPIDPKDQQGTRRTVRYSVDILRAAKKLYYEGGHSPVRAVVSFDERMRIRPGDVQMLAAKLSKYVAEVANLSWTGDVFISNLHDNLDALPMAFRSMWIERSIGENNWDRSGGGCFETMTVEHIKRKLVKKERRVTDYRLKCQELWLVIYYDTDEATWFDVPDSLFDHTFETGFDRVFLFNWFRQQVRELRVSGSNNEA